MQTYTDKQIQDSYDRLPLPVRTFIESAKFKDVMIGITNILNLHVDTSGILYDETLFVLLNLTPAQEFVKRIEKKLNINEIEAAQIAEAINDNIFTVIRKEVLNAPEKKNEVKESKTPKRAPVKPSLEVTTPRYEAHDPYRESIEE